MPGGRNLWIVTRKLRPVKIDEKPSRNTPDVATSTGVLLCSEYGVYSVQPAARPPNGPAPMSTVGPPRDRLVIPALVRAAVARELVDVVRFGARLAAPTSRHLPECANTSSSPVRVRPDLEARHAGDVVRAQRAGR